MQSADALVPESQRAVASGAAPLTDALRAEWTREALRLHSRYEREIVDALALCPWAGGARAGGSRRATVLLQTSPGDLDASLASIAEHAASASDEVVFLIYPRLAVDRRGFEEFAAGIRDADAARYELGHAPFVFAAFHPEAEADVRAPERLIPFLRRTPDATLQLLRSTVLDRVRAGAPQGTQFVDASTFASMESAATEAPTVPLREQIASANLATVERVGVDEVKRRLDDMRLDRERTYAGLARRCVG
jgi:hypothetical protein